MLDHIVSDATSYPILTAEITAHLTNNSLSRGPAPELRVQFPDYAVWQNKTNDIWRKEHETYWSTKLAQLTRLAIPTDWPPNGSPQQRSNVVYTPFGKQLTAKLRDAARRERCLMPLIILSLYLVVMSIWCERNDMPVTLVSHGRHGHPEFRDMIGCIAHEVFLRVLITPNDSLRDLLARVTAEFSASLVHDASRVISPGGASGDTTELYFNWLPTDWGFSGAYPSAVNQAEDNRLVISRFPIETPIITKFKPSFTDTPSGIVAMVWYSDDLFLRSTVERFAAQLIRLAGAFVETPRAPIRSLTLRI